jgi:hypothetical protein
VALRRAAQALHGHPLVEGRPVGSLGRLLRRALRYLSGAAGRLPERSLPSSRLLAPGRPVPCRIDGHDPRRREEESRTHESRRNGRPTRAQPEVTHATRIAFRAPTKRPPRSPTRSQGRYSPECLEGVFPELRAEGVLRSPTLARRLPPHHRVAPEQVPPYACPDQPRLLAGRTDLTEGREGVRHVVLLPRPFDLGRSRGSRRGAGLRQPDGRLAGKPRPPTRRSAWPPGR